jgi:hypothetical protein
MHVNRSLLIGHAKLLNPAIDLLLDTLSTRTAHLFSSVHIDTHEACHEW